MRRVVKVLGGLALLALLAVALLVWKIEAVVLAAMTPGAAFEAEVPPAAPDYGQDGSWSALPWRADSADDAPPGSPGVDPLLAAADVFYVHPTSYLGQRWNAPVDDPALNAATDAVATRIQAAAFNACCAVYAPRYRQTSGMVFVHPSADGDRAVDLAYHDVRRAFEAFLERRGGGGEGGGRPFLIAAHSQGTMLAERLLIEEIAGTPLRKRLVAAWLIGGTVSAEVLAEHAPDLPPCRGPEEVGCVIAWNARRVGYERGPMELLARHGRPLLCTDPLSWRTDGAASPASANLGAVFLESDDPAPRPGFADARCVDGTLRVREVGEAPRDMMSSILDYVLGAGNLHPIEYQLYFMNIRENAGRRVARMLRDQPPSATPIPSPTQLPVQINERTPGTPER